MMKQQITKATEELKNLKATEQSLEHRKGAISTKLSAVREQITVVSGTLAACTNE